MVTTTVSRCTHLSCIETSVLSLCRTVHDLFVLTCSSLWPLQRAAEIEQRKAAALAAVASLEAGAKARRAAALEAALAAAEGAKIEAVRKATVVAVDALGKLGDPYESSELQAEADRAAIEARKEAQAVAVRALAESRSLGASHPRPPF
jgi:hypothetical protein